MLTGPPFVFDPTMTYPDQNVQAWAQYYAQGGTDPTGSVYFISVPGITSARSPTAAAAQHQPAEGQQQQQQQQQAASATASLASSVSPHVITQGLQRQSSLPNPYGPSSSPTAADSTSGPASAASAGPGVGARAPWQAATLSGQFAQMRMGEPSVGA